MARSIAQKPVNNGQVINGKGSPDGAPALPCTLVFLDAAKNIPEGTEQTLEASYISIGRDADCLVCYGEEFPMVSRLHAAIEWKDESYSLRHLSTTNQTLLNGRPINRRWFLHNGDLIQLAPSGPKLKFKLPEAIETPASKKKVDPQQLAMMAVLVLVVILLIWLFYVMLMP